MWKGQRCDEWCARTGGAGALLHLTRPRPPPPPPPPNCGNGPHLNHVQQLVPVALHRALPRLHGQTLLHELHMGVAGSQCSRGVFFPGVLLFEESPARSLETGRNTKASFQVADRH